MQTLRGNSCYLRALEPEDLEFVHTIENDLNYWELSNTQTPFSKFVIRQYLENAKLDIYEIKQLRLAICDNATNSTLGLIDLFDFDPKNSRAGIGIIIYNEIERNKGFGKEALKLLVEYAFSQLQLHQVYANINASNISSIALFTGLGFELIGMKKDWNKTKNGFQDEAMYQLIATN